MTRPPLSGFVAYAGTLAALAGVMQPRALLVLGLAAPLLLARRWFALARAHAWSLFLRAKLASVLLCAVALSLCALLGAADEIVWWTAAALLALNIAEACALDLAHRAWPRALAGLLLIAALASFTATALGERPQLTTDWPWIVAYTAWNASFVYDRWDGISFGQHAAVLSGALLAALALGPEHWLWARTVTLTAHMIVFASFFPQVRAHWDTHGLRHPALATASAYLALALAAWSLGS